MWIVSVQRGRTRKWNRILGPSETQAQLDLGAIFVYAVHVGSLLFLIEWHLEKSYAL